MRLIDADALVNALMSMRIGCLGLEPLVTVKDVLRITKEMQTAEPKRGRWILEKDPYEFFDAIPVCSNCGTTTKYREKYPYCPWCGAKMEGDETDEQVQET